MLKFILFLVFITSLINCYTSATPSTPDTTYARSSCCARFSETRYVLPKNVIKIQPCFYLYNTFKLSVTIKKGPINYSVYILSQAEYDRFSKNNNTLSLAARNGTFIDTSKVNIIVENSNTCFAEKIWYDLILPDGPHFVIKNDAEEIVEIDYFFELHVSELYFYTTLTLILTLTIGGAILFWCTFFWVIICGTGVYMKITGEV